MPVLLAFLPSLAHLSHSLTSASWDLFPNKLLAHEPLSQALLSGNLKWRFKSKFQAMRFHGRMGWKNWSASHLSPSASAKGTSRHAQSLGPLNSATCFCSNFYTILVCRGDCDNSLSIDCLNRPHTISILHPPPGLYRGSRTEDPALKSHSLVDFAVSLVSIGKPRLVPLSWGSQEPAPSSLSSGFLFPSPRRIPLSSNTHSPSPRSPEYFVYAQSPLFSLRAPVFRVLGQKETCSLHYAFCFLFLSPKNNSL
jgi:hypothetical protein